MTERLYYTDSYLTHFHGRLVDSDDGGRRVYLDRTAFYPSSGGQPFDVGTLGGVRVTEVIDEGERIAHVLEAPVSGTDVEGAIDWRRRFDHMQQHSGQHLLSAVFVELFGIPTLSFHLGEQISTIDLSTGTLGAAQVEKAVERANGIVFEDRPLGVTFEDAGAVGDLRKPSDREGTLRIVSIDGIDRSACGGTHVRRTGEIGPVLIRKLDKIRGNVRVEFLCGARAVRRAQADYDALARISRAFSAPIDETPGLVSAQMEKLQEAEKVRRRLATELAVLQGRALYGETAADAAGVRKVVRRIAKGSIDEDLRAVAQGFTGGANAVFVALIEDPPAVLLAASKDGTLHAGDTLKRMLAEVGGRGGGNAQTAQGSLPSPEALTRMAELLG